MKKNKGIFTIILCIAIFMQSGFGAWATEPDADMAEDVQEIQTEDVQDGGQTSEENTDNGEGTDAEKVLQDNLPENTSEVQPENTSEILPEMSAESQPETDEYEEDLEFEEYIKEAQDALSEIASQDPLMALIYLCDYYGLKKEADINSEDLVWIPSGTTVLINGVALDQDYTIWYRVSVEHNGASYTGYVDRNYLAYSNEVFTAWENNYFAKIALFAADMGGYPDIEQFPASYRDKLTQLKQIHPNWIFVRQNTGLDWQKVVNSENSKGRSLINSVMGAAYRNGYHSPGWYYASEAAVKYYLDPRNFLDETRIFQFEQLTYNPSYHSKAAVQNILSNTFMKGELPGAGMTYADAFFQVGVSLKVSPFHLACRVYQEQGDGKSALISGNYDAVPSYKGYYNYFNIGASGTTTKQVVESGLAKAVKEGWSSPYASIKGGAGILSNSYILRGQDTLYLQKFDVDASDGTLYSHQYMQNIMAPYTESQMVKTAYSKINSLGNSFVFKIPVYENMPASACPVPSQVTPTAKPTPTPTAKPTPIPTPTPTLKPTMVPTAPPTLEPTAPPTMRPTMAPTATPTARPTLEPAATPTGKPAAISTATPTGKPGVTPTSTAKPTETVSATNKPAATDRPTAKPTDKPTAIPTSKPTTQPTNKPTAAPTAKPTAQPTAAPTAKPTAPPTAKPTAAPTAKPTAAPTAQPTAPPTAKPTAKPAVQQAAQPTVEPVAPPTAKPMAQPTDKPAAESAATSAPMESQEVSVQGEGTGTTSGTDNAKAAESTSYPVSTQENTNSMGLTVAAATPKPQTAEEDATMMDVGQTGMVYAESLKQIKEQGIKVMIQINDQINWIIDGSTIEDEVTEDFDMGVRLGTSQIPKEMLKALAQNENYVEMSLAHEGVFGFTAQLSVKLEKAQPGQYANLFYYNEVTNAFEFMCATQVSSTGRASYEFRHASDYVIVISDEIKDTLLDEKAKEIVKAQTYIKAEMPTKEPAKAAGVIALIILITAGIGLGIYLIFRKIMMEED